MLQLLPLLASFAVATYADYAVLRSISGPVTIRPLGHQDFKPAQPGASLIAGDAVKTGPGGVAHLQLQGGVTLLVTGDSSLVLGGEAEDPTVEFGVGEWLMGLRRRLGKGRRVRVSTPHAVAAVRGTLFWGKTDSKETLLAGLQDKVELTAQGKTVVVGPDQLARVPAGAAPEPPKPHQVPAPFLDRFRVAGGLGDIEKLLRKPNTPRK